MSRPQAPRLQPSRRISIAARNISCSFMLFVSSHFVSSHLILSKLLGCNGISLSHGASHGVSGHFTLAASRE
jgi:hypothetical protein